MSKFNIGKRVRVLWGSSVVEGIIIEKSEGLCVVDVNWIYGNDHVKINVDELIRLNKV